MRFAAVLAAPHAAAPPGVDPEAYRDALFEDVYEVIHALDLVRPAVAAPAELADLAESVIWPGTPVVVAATPLDALRGLERLGATEAVVVAPDAPDLPGLILGKLFRALGSRDVAVSPAAGGGLVALAARLPLPSWLPEIAFDDPEALDVLRKAGPVFKSPGWHRLRTPGDVHLLDPGLEGWDNTRALLS
ncbi:hypothetical protein [Actinocorallia longicatena]|uniref:Uncharacterized protein n=1 Tax=Actinocorallia longicatena TaxID=111803 RepID=A0ABP6Q0G8_9ACTN